jgi:nitroreductase
MNYYDIVNKRRMVRNFSDEPVDEAAIQRILEAARHSPSAGFTQGQDFIVVTNSATKQKNAELCGQEGYVQGGFDPFISKAPVLIVPCANEGAYHRRYQQPDKVQDDGTEIELVTLHLNEEFAMRAATQGLARRLNILSY